VDTEVEVVMAEDTATAGVMAAAVDTRVGMAAVMEDTVTEEVMEGTAWDMDRTTHRPTTTPWGMGIHWDTVIQDTDTGALDAGSVNP